VCHFTKSIGEGLQGAALLVFPAILLPPVWAMHCRSISWQKAPQPVGPGCLDGFVIVRACSLSAAQLREVFGDSDRSRLALLSHDVMAVFAARVLSLHRTVIQLYQEESQWLGNQIAYVWVCGSIGNLCDHGLRSQAII